MDFLWLRLPKKRLLLAILVALIISSLQLKQLLNVIPLGNSPYTRWLSIDPFSFSPIIFFILLPLIASIPSSTLFKNDLESGLLAKFKLKFSLPKVMRSYMAISFFSGFIVIMIPLLSNLLFYFMVLPNIQPDNLLNSNLLLINQNTMLVNLYYAHPLIHALISILFASIWGGLFSIFVMVTSIWIKNTFVALSMGLIVQIIILMLNSFIKLPNLISYSPADFLHEMAPMSNINLLVTSVVTLLMLMYCIIFYKLGEKRLVSYCN